MGRGDSGSASTTNGHGTAKATPRIRNKITHKTRLRIIHGDVEADRMFGDDEHDGKSLATGVDAEDANEYHLLAALKASQPVSTSTFCQPSTSNNKKTSLVPPAPPPPVAYIPTPDATGKVDNYGQFYLELPSQPSTLLAKASETVEEAQATECLAAGYAYVMDERDADWLERNNKLANGEGPSNAGGSPSSGRGSRSAKAKGKDPETPLTVVIAEDDFELVMGLFEKLTDDKSPYLHLSPTDFPPFSDYDAFFSVPVPPHLFPSFTIPPSVPEPLTLYNYARIIYPHWRERKMDRGGHRIIPQLNYDETNESDPYVCFRRRMPKPLRKTRRQDPTSLDRLSRLSDELHKVLKLAEMTLQREQLKLIDLTEWRGVCEARSNLIEVRRKAASTSTGASWLAGVNDDELIAEKDCTGNMGGIAVIKKLMSEAERAAAGVSGGPGGGGQTIKLKRLRDDPAPAGGMRGMDSSAMLPIELHQLTMRRLADMQHAVDREVAKRKDGNWEDVTENAYQHTSLPFSLRHFRTTSGDSSSSTSPTSPSDSTSSTASSSGRPPPSSSSHQRSGIALRLRTGRGGRTLLDRRPPPPASSSAVDVKVSRPVLPPLSMPFPPNSGNISSSQYWSRPSLLPSGNGGAEDERERAWKVEERWKYDSEAGVLVGGTGLAERIGAVDGEDARLIVDDFEFNTFQVRKQLLFEEDFSGLLRTDDAMLKRAEMFHDNRKEAERAFAQEALAKALVTRREMAARQPPPPPPPTPAAAAAVSQMKKQPPQVKLTQGPGGRVQHPLATSTTPLSAGMDLEPDTSNAADGNGIGSSPAPLGGSTPASVSVSLNGVPSIPNGKPPSSSSNVNGFLQPPASTASIRPSASPSMRDGNAVLLPSSSPTPPSPPKASSAAQSQLQQIQQHQQAASQLQLQSMAHQQQFLAAKNGLANGNNNVNMNLSAYGMIQMLPNGYPMTSSANAGNSNASSAQNTAMLLQIQRMANANGAGAQMMLNGNGVNGMTSQQQQQQAAAMMGLKGVNLNGTVFAQHTNGMSTPQSMMNGNGSGQQAAFPHGHAQQQQLNAMMMNGNGNMPQNMGISLGNGNISLKLPAQRAMQWASANGQVGQGNSNGSNNPLQLGMKGTTASDLHTMVNGVNGNHHVAQQHQQQQHSSSPQRQQNSSSPAPAARLSTGGNGGLVGRNSPLLSSSGMNGRASPGVSGMMMANGTSPSPRMTAAPQVGHMPSPLAAAQQIVGLPGQAKVHGF
ncbi:Enhancer of polycomb-like protein 1 [Tulasnella sp. 331]|nr:Enhancer of polycomb-like protein 1 [Tulasnella sp. 331]